MNKRKRIGRMVLCLIISFVMVMTLIPRMPAGLAFAADGDEQLPTNPTKTRASNNNGTYKIELSITGDAQTNTDATKANVIIIMDTSGSMSDQAPTANTSPTGRYGYRNESYINLYTRNANGTYSQINNNTTPGPVYYRTGNYNYQYHEYTTTRYTSNQGESTRLAQTKTAVNSLIDTLLAQNQNISDMIEIAYMTFGSSAAYRTPSSATGTGWVSGTNGTTLKNTVSTTNANTGQAAGTNWDDALHDAKALADAKTDGDKTYIVFFTDGEPTFNNGGVNGQGNHTHGDPQQGGGSYTTTADIESAEYEATQLNSDNYDLYGIFAYGDPENYNYMTRVLTKGNGSADGFGFYADNQSSLNEAFAAIASAVSAAVGVEQVTLSDGTTSSVEQTSGKISHLLSVDESSYEYWMSWTVAQNGTFEMFQNGKTTTYTATQNGNNIVITWTENGEAKTVTYEGTKNGNVIKIKWDRATEFYNYAPPEAEFESDAVNWDLSEVGEKGTLLDGVTYSYSFNVYPAQDTYDIIAQLKNGDIEYDSLDKNIKEYIKPDGHGGYTLETNTEATYSYYDAITETTHQGTMDNPPAVTTDASQMTIKKTWENSIDDYDKEPLNMSIMQKTGSEVINYGTVALNDGNDYQNSIYIATGLLTTTKDAQGNVTDIKVLDTGHDYYMAEPVGVSYHWDLIAETVHPMLIDGVLTTLVKADEPSGMAGKNYYKEGNTEYYRLTDGVYKVKESGATVSAENKRRNTLLLTKELDANGFDIPEGTKFTFDMTVDNNIDNPSADDEDVWFAVYKKGTTSFETNNIVFDDTIVTGAEKEIATIDTTRTDTVSADNVVPGSVSGDHLTYKYGANQYTVKIASGPAADGSYTYYVYEVIGIDEDAGTVTYTRYGTEATAPYEGMDGNNPKYWTGFWHAPSGAANVKAELEEGQIVRYTNLPIGSTYTFVEEEPTDGFAYEKAEATVKTGSAGSEGTDPNATVTDAQRKVEGTMNVGNSIYKTTYTNNMEKVDITATKVWEDNDNQDGLRTAVTLHLNKSVDGGTPTVVTGQDKTIPEGATGDALTVTWEDLSTVENGKTVTYSVTEDEIDGYTTEITKDENGANAYIVTNTHTPETTEATVVKVWDDSNNQDGKRPLSLEVTLSNGNKVTLNEGNKWTATVSNLPKYSNGTEINYTWTEGEMPKGYSLTNTVKNGTVTTLTNSYTPETTTVNAEKIWKSGSTTLTEAPEDITLHLNKKVGTADAVVVDRQDKTIAKGASGDALKVSWTGLPKYEAGQLITYTVTEDTVAGYTTTITGDAATGFVITNSNVTVDTSTEAILNKNVTVENKVKASTFTFDMVEVTDATGETPVTGAETITGEVTYAAGEKGTKIVDFGELTYGGGTEYPEVHYYKITEKNIPDGWTATPVSAVATVTIQKSADGSLEATVTPAQINNAYSVASTTYTLSASKTLRVESGNNAPDVSGKYDLTLKDANGNVVGTVKQNPDGKGTAVEFETITYTAAGDYVYTVSETCNAEGGKIDGVTDDPEAAGKTVIVSVTDDGEGHLSAAIKEGSGSQKTNFTNVYNAAPAELELSASKTLSKASNAANPPTVDRKYDLTLTAVDNAPMPEGATNGSISVKNPDGAGTAESFGKITYTVPGTYTYTISESGEAIAGVTNDADAAGKTVVVTVTDDGKGKLIASVTTGGAKTNFTNTYSVTDSEPVKLEAAKVLQGRNLKAGEFSFELKGADGTVIETAANGAGGAVEFETEFTYSAVGDYTYTINEVIPENKLPNVEYDSSVKEVVIHVADNGEGALVATVEYKGVEEEGDVPTFTNVYTPGPTEANISLTKELTGRTLKAGEFSFTMTDAEGETVETVNNDKDGNVNFSAIEYNAEGEYTYTIKENIPTGDDKLGGVTYSEEAIEVTVNVTYSADTGLYTATVNYPTDKTFNNDYTAEPTSATLTATKVLTGRPLVAGEFSFELKDAEGNVLQTATNAADGSVTFTPIAYEFGDDGEYTYTISEVKGKLGGVTYDEHVATAKVVVTDDLKGNMAAAVTYYNGETPIEGAPVFNNTYAPSPTDATIVVTKELTGRTLKAGEFSFSLVDKDGKLVGTATNAADGKVTFTVKGIDKVGTYTYTVSENIPADEEKLGGVTYASNTVEVSVVVTDDLAGKLVAETQYPEVTKFVNEYKANGSFNPEVTKVYEGDDELVAGMFKFEIFDSEGTKIGEATNDATGKVTFGALNYTEQNVGKTYTYTIKEVKGDKRFVTYDDTEITLTVTVADNGDGTLRFTKEYKDTNTFTNIFKIIYGNLNINKTLNTIYDVDADNKDDVNTTVVFSVKAVLDGEKVYNDVVSIDFSNGGTLPAEVVGKIPVGSVVTVEEIYCSGSYKLTAGPEPTTVTIERENQTVEIAFTNTYTNKLIQGYGILNEYSKEEGKDWTHNGSQEKEDKD